MAKVEIGKEFTFLVDLNTSATTAGERWAKVGKRREGGISMSNNLVDTTTADDGGFTSNVVATRTWSGSFTVNYDPFGIAISFMLARQLDFTTTDYRLKVRFDEPNGLSWKGFVRVESMEPSFPIDGPADLSVSFQGDGSLTQI